MSLFATMAAVTVTIFISVPNPSPKHPKEYGLSQCTGVFVSPTEVLTAGHCVARSRGHQWIKTLEGQSFSATVEKLDVKNDLALLKVDRAVNHKVVAKIGKPVVRTNHIYTVNTGEGYKLTYNEGVVSNLIKDEDYGTPEIMHSAFILHGASGSGLFNKKGQLVGINVAIIGPFAIAVDLPAINKLLE